LAGRTTMQGLTVCRFDALTRQLLQPHGGAPRIAFRVECPGGRRCWNEVRDAIAAEVGMDSTMIVIQSGGRGHQQYVTFNASGSVP
jgi:hypothetical protein